MILISKNHKISIMGQKCCPLYFCKLLCEIYLKNSHLSIKLDTNAKNVRLETAYVLKKERLTLYKFPTCSSKKNANGGSIPWRNELLNIRHTPIFSIIIFKALLNTTHLEMLNSMYYFWKKFQTYRLHNTILCLLRNVMEQTLLS